MKSESSLAGRVISPSSSILPIVPVVMHTSRSVAENLILPLLAVIKTLLKTGSVVRVPTTLPTWFSAFEKFDCKTIIFTFFLSF
jgi:hypothetical protein